jgi:hypothetical protein
MNCRIPFTFMVNGKALPAGSYLVANNNGILLVQGGKDAAVVLSNGTSRPADRSGHGSVVFLKTGDRYDLIEVWSPDGSGREVRLSRKQVELRRDAATAPAERIVIHAM